MTQTERRLSLIRDLLDEQQADETIPTDAEAQKRLLRALLNVRPPMPASERFLRVQDAYLAEALREKGIVTLSQIPSFPCGLSLWRGDITRLAVDAIVNAANSGMTGCYHPNHGCIDNCIHTYAGVQLRLFCAQLMERQGHDEPVGQAKLTPAFNLPSRFVLHTVGPYAGDGLTALHERQLAACYRACLDLADAHALRSVAFCCISTGVFGFPNKRAAEIAVATVTAHPAVQAHRIQVIFNVFQQQDEQLYRAALSKL